MSASVRYVISRAATRSHDRLWRLRSLLWPILETAGAAVAAWYLAKLLLGDKETGFAPIAAVICLGATIGQQRERALELIVGVVVGVLIADLLVRVIGTGPPQVGLMVVLAMSAAAKSQDQILPMLVISLMLSIVFCGGMIPVTGRLGLDQLSWAIPARFGFAASASTADLHTIAPLLQTNDTLWSHHAGWWLLDMTALIVLGAVLAGGVRWRIRLNGASQILDRTTRYRHFMRLGGSPLGVVRRRQQAARNSSHETLPPDHHLPGVVAIAQAPVAGAST